MRYTIIMSDELGETWKVKKILVCALL